MDSGRSTAKFPAALSDDGLPPGLQDEIRLAQDTWSRVDISRRIRVISDLRCRLMAAAETLAEASASARGVDIEEVYATEILTLMDACQFLEDSGERILKPRKLSGRGRPLWLWGTSAELVREPFGQVLILSPSNYPLFLAGVQACQALVAGNAVLVKPAPGCEAPLDLLARLLEESGLPKNLFTVLPTGPEWVTRWIQQVADLVLLTGGVKAGKAVMSACAESLVPCIMELSGLDSFHVLADANLDRVMDALLFGLRLNQGRTCIAPRRILVQREVAFALRERLERVRSSGPRVTLGPRTQADLRTALDAGAVIRCGRWHEKEGAIDAPLVLEGVPRDSSFWRTDHFAPVSLLAEMEGVEEAIRFDRDCPFALGASIFGRDLRAANQLARRLPACSITINDTVAPTADPRLPFGGCRQSGFGVTRGEEGLLSLTRTKVIVKRPASSWAPHLDPPAGGRDRWLLQVLHGRGLVARWNGFLRVISALRQAKAEKKGRKGD